jgi:hypothetical protein
VESETETRKVRCRLHHALAALLVAGSLMFAAYPLPISAAEVVITVKGTVAPQSTDDYGIFQVGRDLKGQEFTLTITFDDSKSAVRVTNDCPVSEISQTSGSSPARVVLKIGPGSYIFGTKPESKWSAYKSTAPNCGGVAIGFHVMEGVYPQTSLLWLTLQPPPGGSQFTGSVQWQTPISSPRVDGSPTLGQFTITRPGDYQHVTRGWLMARSMTEGPGKGGDSVQMNDAPATSETSNADRANGQTVPPAQGATPQPSLKERFRKAVGGLLHQLPTTAP